MSKTNQLLESCKKTFDSIIELLTKKNSDYAGDGEAYKNFLDPELQKVLDKEWKGMDAVELGIRVRLKDKWSRINTLFLNQKEAAVKDEQIEDTLKDTIGYLGIWLAYREWKRAEFLKNNIPPDLPPAIPYKTAEDWGEEECKCGHMRINHTMVVGKCTVKGCGCLKFEGDKEI